MSNKQSNTKSSKKLNACFLVFVIFFSINFEVLADPISQNAVNYYSLGRNWQKQGNLPEAEKAFLQAISFAPNDAELKINLAQVFFKQDRLNEALEQFDLATKINPLNARYRLLYAKSLLIANQSDKAIQEYIQATDLEPNYLYINLGLSQAYQAAGNYAASIKPLKIALSEDINNTNILLMLASAHQKINLLDSACQNYQQALSINPNDENIRLSYAKALVANSKLNEANDQYKVLIAKQPENDDLWSSLAEIENKQGNLQAAIDSMKKAIEINSQNAFLHAILAGYYSKAKDIQSALQEYSYAAELETNPEVKNKYYLAQAQILFEKGKFDQASQIITFVLAQNPNDASLKTQLADIRLWQRKYSEAIGLYKAAFSADPNLYKNKRILFNYGAALGGIKNWPSAEYIWQEYIKLDKSSKEAWLNLAMSQEEQKKYAEAVFSYRKAITNGADKTKIFNEIGPLQVKINDLAGAENTYRELVNLHSSQSKYRIALSKILSKQGREEEALKLLREGSQASLDLKLEIADRIAKSGNYYSATSEYQKVLSQEPNNLSAMIGLADSYSAIGQFNEAIDLYKSYLNRQSSDFEAQYNFALALASVGRMTDAVKEYKKAINLNSSSAEAYYGLGAAYVEIDSNQAREAWKRYLDLQPQGEFKSEILHRFPDLK